MKRFFSLSALLLAITFLLFNSNSFTTAEIKNEATLSVVSEENALIAIEYEEGGIFTVTNNTEKTIEIESVQLTSGSGNDIINTDYASINPGGSSQFTIIGDPEPLYGTTIQLMASWNGGSAEIQSMIPESTIAQWVQEFIAEDLKLELFNGIATLEMCEEKATSEIDDEKTTPEMCKEKVASENDEDKAVETMEEETVDETNVTEPIDEESLTEMEDETESTDIEEEPAVETAANNKSGE
ncbi:hypothetical protein [Sporosarcina sp. FA9]|uniref:hypothetical protein n=1 Tax=Sporosarcina sp. FA9 TaxID=3413030 RepID=UPI003F657CB0